MVQEIDNLVLLGGVKIDIQNALNALITLIMCKQTNSYPLKIK